jgi:hypothetical protein
MDNKTKGMQTTWVSSVQHFVLEEDERD